MYPRSRKNSPETRIILIILRIAIISEVLVFLRSKIEAMQHKSAARERRAPPDR